MLWKKKDTGLSVRKRVIKILRDLCLQDPRQPLTAEICCKLVSRIGDEESIRVNLLFDGNDFY